ncbi:unnamed protein product [Rhizoctonia solani]|uniref:Uncharacterized protein n=1 Tax=Rhizoctonia solani TaxID=456999 RepID=A0A8H3BNV2_9AGAM|nr:unnamed protein product [Rhizoctonia solani]
MFGSKWQTDNFVFASLNSTATMSIERETPNNQYAKREYRIRLIGQVPVIGSDGDDDDDHDYDSDGEPIRNDVTESRNDDKLDTTTPKPVELKFQGTPLCSIDVTMSHVAVMYAAGRLLDSIREPFNASVVRAEMNLLRVREEVKVSPEDYDKWKKEKYEAKCIDPLVSDTVHDPNEAHVLVPQCPYLCQLLFKSFSVGGNPGFWSGAREMLHLQKEGVRNVRGRAGADTLKRRNVQAWFLYIDVSDPLRPRYAFIEEQNIIDSTRVFDNGDRKPLYIFNAREHAYQLMIPESESYSGDRQFGEAEWTRHREGITPTGRRGLIKLPDDPSVAPDYKALLVSRMKRAQEHPAVIRMQAFGWFTAEDAINLDTSALLQGIWRFSLKSSQSSYHNSVVRLLLNKQLAGGAIIIRSQPMDEPDHAGSPKWDYSFAVPPVLASTSDSEISLKSAALRAVVSIGLSKAPGGILSSLDTISSRHPAIFPEVKIELARILKERSSKSGTGFHEEALEWLSSGGAALETESQPPEDSSAWLEHDYDIPENHATHACNEGIWWILAYQGFCYRASVNQERLSRSISDEVSSFTQPVPVLTSTTDNPWDDEFPGRPLGDVAHPAFDVSNFPRISERQLLSALQEWSNTIWLPTLDNEDWDFNHSTPVLLRTLNVSGCHFVTRNTIRQALQIAPSITRIIMIGCESFDDTDLTLLSLDGTLNNIDCILTSETARDPFLDPGSKKQRRDDAYNRARALLPQAPNDKIRAKLASVPGVFFNSTEGFKFKYSQELCNIYYAGGLASRSLSHSFPRPPALGFDPTTGKVVCGPPRFSIMLATHSIADMPLTGATLPRVPVDTGIEGMGTNGCGLTSVWRGIIDLLELLGDPYMRNKQRWNMIKWSLVVKSCFSGPGQKWEKKSGLAGGGEFYGFPAYFKGGTGQANEEWIFAYQFRDVVARMQTYWANGSVIDSFVYPESSTQDCWAFIRYGRDANPLSHKVPTIVLYNVREFRQAICPDIPILEDEAKWMARVEDILANGTWHPSYPIVNWEVDRGMACNGDPTWGQFREVAKRMTKPKYMKEVPHELILLVERMMTCQMNAGSDPF